MFLLGIILTLYLILCITHFETMFDFLTSWRQTYIGFESCLLRNIADNINGSKQYLFFIKNRLTVGCMFNLSAFTFTFGENVMCDIISNSNKWFSYTNSDHHAFVWPEFYLKISFYCCLLYTTYIFLYIHIAWIFTGGAKSLEQCDPIFHQLGDFIHFEKGT